MQLEMANPVLESQLLIGLSIKVNKHFFHDRCFQKIKLT